MDLIVFSDKLCYLPLGIISLALILGWARQRMK